MTKMMIAIVGLTLLLAVALGCSGLGLAVREGAMSEVLVRFPPGARYQMIIRVGGDSVPWDRSRGQPVAINVWAHGQNTDWHIVRLVHLPLGKPAKTEK